MSRLLGIVLYLVMQHVYIQYTEHTGIKEHISGLVLGFDVRGDLLDRIELITVLKLKNRNK